MAAGWSAGAVLNGLKPHRFISSCDRLPQVAVLGEKRTSAADRCCSEVRLDAQASTAAGISFHNPVPFQRAGRAIRLRSPVSRSPTRGGQALSLRPWPPRRARSRATSSRRRMRSRAPQWAPQPRRPRISARFLCLRRIYSDLIDGFDRLVRSRVPTRAVLAPTAGCGLPTERR